MLGFLVASAWLLWTDRSAIDTVLQSWGIVGIASSILAMALLCATPFPIRRTTDPTHTGVWVDNGAVLAVLCLERLHPGFCDDLYDGTRVGDQLLCASVLGSHDAKDANGWTCASTPHSIATLYFVRWTLVLIALNISLDELAVASQLVSSVCLWL